MYSIILQGMRVRDIGRLLHTSPPRPCLWMGVKLTVFQAEGSLPELREI